MSRNIAAAFRADFVFDLFGGVRVLTPTVALEAFSDVTPELLIKYNIDAIILDVDNTVSPPSSQEIYEGVEAWLDKIKGMGIEIVICSNNFKKRVYPFAKSIGLDCVAMSFKPLPFGFIRAKKKLSVKPKNVLVIGDQIFTDILGARLAGMKSALLIPRSPERGATIRLRRMMERHIRKKLYGEKYK